MLNKDIVEKLKNYLTCNSLTPRKLARLSGLTYKTIYLYLRTGKIGPRGSCKIKRATKGELDLGISYKTGERKKKVSSESAMV